MEIYYKTLSLNAHFSYILRVIFERYSQAMRCPFTRSGIFFFYCFYQNLPFPFISHVYPFSLNRTSFYRGHPEVFCKKDVHRNLTKFTGKHLCQKLFWGLRPATLKESLAQVFSCKFCEISKNTFYYRTLPVAASDRIYYENVFTWDIVWPLNVQPGFPLTQKFL